MWCFQALMLNELIREIPISRVSEKYQVPSPLPFLGRFSAFPASSLSH